MFDGNGSSNEILEKSLPPTRGRRSSGEPGDLVLVEAYREAVTRSGRKSEEASLAFEPIFRRHWPQIYNLALNKIGALYADDLAAETMQTLVERLNGKEVVTNLKGLLRHSFEREYASMLERLFQGKKLLRGQPAAPTGVQEETGRVKGAVVVSLNAPVAGNEGEELELMQTLVDPSADVVEAASRRELVTTLRQLIERMPVQYRGPLVCQWLLGMRIKEVAEELNLSVDQVKHNTARGIKWLQKEMPGSPDEWVL